MSLSMRWQMWKNGSHYFDPNDDKEGAVGEGIADYFAGSHTERSRIGEYCCLGADRNMADPDIASYDEYQNQSPVGEHNGGEFFSAVLWDLHNSGGIATHDADELVFQAIGRVSGSPTFIEYRDAMMAADHTAYGGAHNDLIQDTFYFRGIGTYSLTAYVNGPDFVRMGDTESWSADVSGGQSPYSGHTWYKRADSSDDWLGAGTGTTYTETISSRSDFQLRVCVTDNRSISRCSDAFQVFVR